MKLAIPATLLSVVLSASLGAQSSTSDAPPPPPAPGMQGGGPHGPHGGRFGPGMAPHRVETITNSPFTAQFAETANFTDHQGAQEQRSATSTVYRDSQGRVREEVTLPAPPPQSSSTTEAGTAPAAPPAARGPRRMITIFDPVTHTITHLNVNRKTAYVQTVPADFFSRMQQHMDRRESGQQPQQKRDNVTVTSLGNKTIAGVPATGEQTVIILPPHDNGATHTVTRQSWFSPDAKFEVSSSETSDRGTHATTLTSLNKAEPDPSLFQVPAGYTTSSIPDRQSRGHHLGGPGGPEEDNAPPPPSL